MRILTRRLVAVLRSGKPYQPNYNLRPSKCSLKHLQLVIACLHRLVRPRRTRKVRSKLMRVDNEAEVLGNFVVEFDRLDLLSVSSSRRDCFRWLSQLHRRPELEADQCLYREAVARYIRLGDSTSQKRVVLR